MSSLTRVEKGVRTIHEVETLLIPSVELHFVTSSLGKQAIGTYRLQDI